LGGVCAIIHFDGEPVADAVLSKMLAQAPYRGLHGASTQVWGWKALAAQNLLVSQEEAGVEQPLWDTLGRFALVADARIDNGPELLPLLGEELRLQALDPASLTSAQIILAAYSRWRERAPEYLIGDFAFVVWDEERRQAYCARDPFGVKPLHYAFQNDKLCIASEAQQVLQHPAVRWHLDEVAMADYLLDEPREEARTIFKGVRKVPSGHCLTVTAEAAREKRTWDLGALPRLRYKRPEEYAEKLRELLLRAVRDRLRDDGSRVGLFMSGGLDSCSVAGLGVEELRREGRGRRILAANYAFPTLKDCDEGSLVETMAQELPLEVSYIDAERLWLDTKPEDYQPSFETPFLGWALADAEVFRNLRDQDVKVCLTGLGGDGLFTGTFRVFASLMLRGRWNRAWQGLRAHGQPRRLSPPRRIYRYLIAPFLPRPVEEALRSLAGREPTVSLPPWLAESFARRHQLLEELRRQRFPRVSWDPARQGMSQAIALVGHVSRACYWQERTAARFGIEMRHPLLDRRLAEFAISVPAELHFDGRTPKSLLREAVRGLIPERVRMRTDKTLFGQFLDYSLRDRSRDHIEGLLGSSRLQAMGIVDQQGLREAYEEYRAGDSFQLRTHLWFIVTLELWLRRFGDRFVPDLDAAGYSDP
jgi:asparagine synthase (glutamine-hydrolysing)